MARNTVFNTRRHRPLRKHVPRGEKLVGVAVLALLGGVATWVARTGDDYDPALRDLSPELLAHGRAPIEIYKRPLAPWVPPGGVSAASAPDLGMFPLGVTDEEWQLAGRVRRFDAGNLYEKINGEAEKFLKLGFRAMHYAVLRSERGAGELAIELYDQGDVGGSTGIFAAHGAGERQVEERGGVTFFSTSIGVLGRKGRFFFRAAADRSGDAITRKSERLVDAFAALPDEARADTPEGLRLLTRGMAIREADVSFEARNVFQLDFATDFWFGRLEASGDARVFVHLADTESRASELLDALLAEQHVDYDVLDSDSPWHALRHKYLGSFFAIGRRGRILFGVESLDDRARLGSIMQRFSSAIADG